MKFRRRRTNLLTGKVFRVPTMGERALTFRRKVGTKWIPKASSPLPQTRLPYYLWCIIEIYNLIGSHVPPQHKFPGDIYPWFFWLHVYSTPTSPYNFFANCVWTHHPFKTDKITRIHAHLKTMTQDTPFSDLKSFRMHNQKYLRGFGAIPSS